MASAKDSLTEAQTKLTDTQTAINAARTALAAGNTDPAILDQVEQDLRAARALVDVAATSL